MGQVYETEGTGSRRNAMACDRGGRQIDGHCCAFPMGTAEKSSNWKKEKKRKTDILSGIESIVVVV
jgi:hypothetical protein